MFTAWVVLGVAVGVAWPSAALEWVAAAASPGEVFSAKVEARRSTETGSLAGSPAMLPTFSCGVASADPARPVSASRLRPKRWPARAAARVPQSLASSLALFVRGADVRFVAQREWKCQVRLYSDGLVAFGAYEQLEAGASIWGWFMPSTRACAGWTSTASGCYRVYDDLCLYFAAADSLRGATQCRSRQAAEKVSRISATKVRTALSSPGDSRISVHWFVPRLSRAGSLTCTRVKPSVCTAALADWLAQRRP